MQKSQDPRWRSERARKGGIGRSSPNSYIRSLERADLTDEQKRRLAKLVMSFFAEPAGGAEAGDAA